MSTAARRSTSVQPARQPPAARTRRGPAARAPSPTSAKPLGPSRARKVPTNLSIRGDLVQQARGLGLNLSEVVETALEEAIRKAEQARWLAENERAIDYYNDFVEKHGLFGEEFRQF